MNKLIPAAAALALIGAAVLAPLPTAFAQMRHVPVLLAVMLSISGAVLMLRPKLQARDTKKTLLILIAAYIIIFSALSILRHESLHSTAFDLGIFDQTVWGYSTGENIFNTVRGLVLLGDHAQPILFLLAPLYVIFANANVLLIVQSAAIGLGAWPVYLLARHTLKDEQAALMLGAAFLFSPLLHHINLFDFHPAALAVLPLGVALLALEQHRYRLLLAMLLIVGAAKEHYTLMLITFGAYIALRHNNIRWGAGIALLGAVWFWFNLNVLIPAFSPSYQHVSQLGYLGGSIGEIALGIVQNPLLVLGSVLSFGKLMYLALLLLPFPLAALGAEIAAIAIPSLAINLLRESTGISAILYQHNAELIPFLFAGSILGIQRVAARYGTQVVRRLALLTLLLSISAAVSYGPLSTTYDTDTFTIDGHARAGKALMAQIPADASVSAASWAVPHLSQRETIHMFPNPFTMSAYGPRYWETGEEFDTTEFVLLDTTRGNLLFNDTFYEEQTQRMLSDARYEQVAEDDGWVLLRKVSADR